MMTAAQMRVFDLIKRHVAETSCSPSYDQMAREIGLKSKSNIVRIVDALEERKFIRRHGERGRLGHNIEVLRNDIGIDARLVSLKTWFKRSRPNDYLSAEAAIDVLLKIARSR